LFRTTQTANLPREHDILEIPMRTTILIGLFALLLAHPIACDSGGGDGGPGADTTAADTSSPDTVTPDTAPDGPTPAEGFTVVTYNLGLARNFVPFAEERLADVIAAVAALDADVVCLQEVWEDADRDALLAATADAFPNAQIFETTEDEGAGAACTAEETDPLLACVQEFCAETDDLTGCVLGNCGTQFGAVSQPCATCLAAHISEPIDDIIAACLTGGSQLLFGGRNGLVLLSRLPLGDGGHMALDSFFTQRAVLWQEVITDAGPVHVFCTHLNAALDEVEYGGAFESWEAEQAHQADQLLAWMEDRTGGVQDRILLGDMNSGPAVPPELTGEVEEVFAKFTDAGLTNPYLALDTPPCTWCADNPLTGSEDSSVIDHVLLGGAPAQGTATPVRILTETITVEGVDGAEEIPLSDHYGVAMTLIP
jgi:endonuclease/exonuclease/phosphatase family metal-dependent hydrolase